MHWSYIFHALTDRFVFYTNTSGLKTYFIWFNYDEDQFDLFI